jgi:tRNA/tmRNA/rRNA uracil-C5-methylase (TrmA/RlmC/RlmD family)
MINIAGLDLPHLDDDKLQRCLSGALHSRIGDRTKQTTTYPYWDAAYFNLEKVKVFQDASYEQQQLIVQLANTSLLEEAYAIEKAGVGYMAKMVLLAQTTQERMLYALFSADEATHLAQISQFLLQPPVSKTDPFLHLLADLVESEDKTVLLFVLQIVLEGWGLTHYKHLAKNCLNPQLSTILKGFLQDEARHHNTAVSLFNDVAIEAASKEQIIETLSLFLPMIQAGPQI